MQIESPGVAMANPANLAKTGDGKQSEFCSLAMANLANLANFDLGDHNLSRFSQKSLSHPPELNFSASHRRLSDSDLANLITRTAERNGLDPLDLWRWLEQEDIEALRSGDPAEIRAFRAMIALPGWDSTPPAVTHGLPFPGDQHQEADPERYRVTCGDCRHFERDRIGDGAGIGRCSILTDPPSGLLYPRVERRCSRFIPIPASTTDNQLRDLSANIDRLIKERTMQQSPVAAVFQAMGYTIEHIDTTTSEATR